MNSYDFPPFDRMNIARPTQHAIMFLVYPNPSDAAGISERNHRFRDRAALKGRALRPDRLHITLFSLGVYREDEMPADLIPQARAAGAMVDSPPIEIVLDCLQTFRRNSFDQPLVLTGSGGMKPLRRFREELGLAMINSGLRRFVKSGFNPHMTLLYDRRPVAPRPIDPARWTMTEFVLVDSLRGRTRHVPLARWTLRGGAKGDDSSEVFVPTANVPPCRRRRPGR